MQRITSMVKVFNALSTQTLINRSMFSTFQKQTDHVRALLPTFTSILNPSCGFKIKARVKRRCQSCYIVVRDERVYNICPKFPRHKTMSMKPKPHNTWILTHATQGRVRPW